MGITYQGIMNQFNCLVRAAALCGVTNSTLIIPPLVARDSSGIPIYIYPNIFLNISHMLSGQPFTYWTDIEKHLHGKIAPIILHDRWKTRKMLGLQSKLFLASHQVFPLIELHEPDLSKYSRLNELKKIALNIEYDVILFGNLQHTLLGIDAINIVKRLAFSGHLKRQIAEMKKMVPFTLKNYTTVHWRRGDFRTACLKNKDVNRCFPKVDDIYLKAKYHRVLIASNEYDSEEINSMDHVFHILSKSRRHCDPIKELFLDFYFMIDSSQLIGNSYSSITRNAAIIRAHLNKETNMF
jgi:hypothetical protein